MWESTDVVEIKRFRTLHLVSDNNLFIRDSGQQVSHSSDSEVLTKRSGRIVIWVGGNG